MKSLFPDTTINLRDFLMISEFILDSTKIIRENKSWSEFRWIRVLNLMSAIWRWRLKHILKILMENIFILFFICISLSVTNFVISLMRFSLLLWLLIYIHSSYILCKFLLSFIINVHHIFILSFINLPRTITVWFKFLGKKCLQNLV